MVYGRPRLCSPFGVRSSSHRSHARKCGANSRRHAALHNRAKRWRMRSVAIDLGKVRVGLAISDELGLLAHVRPYLDGTNPGQVVDALAQLATEENVELFVVGLPRTLGGREGAAARRARAFAQKLQIRTGRRVILMDERLTTKQASQELRAMGHSAREQRAVIDSVAAALLLQTYLDASKKKLST